MNQQLPPILEIGDILISSDILTERFCCDLAACKGQCCIEGDAGAPVTMDEIAEIEDALDEVWSDMSASAQAVVDKQGVAYTDEEGDLVTSIVNGKDCVFTYYDEIEDFSTKQPIHGCCLCTLEKAFRNGRSSFCKPISCALYPIREKTFSDGTVALNYHKWHVCKDAVKKGQELNLPVYRFLEGPLVRRFGQEWYDELCAVAKDLKTQGYI
jgi:Fe-S-cluster containining protein